MPWIWNHFPLQGIKRLDWLHPKLLRMYFIYFMEERFSCKPQTQPIDWSVNACAGMFSSAGVHTDCTYVHPSASTLHTVSGVSAACQWVHEEAGATIVCVLLGLRYQALGGWWRAPPGHQLSPYSTEGSATLMMSAGLSTRRAECCSV